MSAYGVASKYGVILPYSRKQEAEADHIGLMLMARAGYDPREAPAFWDRFSRLGGEKPAEFLSTHPSDATRAATLRQLLPQAQELYAQAATKYGFGDAMPLAVNPLPVAQPVSSLTPQAGLRNPAIPMRPRSGSAVLKGGGT